MFSYSQRLQTAITISFQIFLLFLPFIWTPFTSELFEFPKMLTVYAFTIVITGFWLARMAVTKKVIYQNTFLDLPLYLFLASQILSTIFSIDRHTSVWGYYSRYHGGLMSTISYLLLYRAAVSNLTVENVKTTLKLVLAGTAVASLYAFLEHFGHSFSCLLITHHFNDACWIQDVQNRVFGTFGQPNWLAAYLITIIFIPLGYLVTRLKLHLANLGKNWLPVVSGVLLTGIYFATLLFTKSKSGILGFAVGLAVFSLVLLISYRNRLQKILTALVSCYVLLVVGFLAFGKGVLPQTDSLIFNRFSAPPAPSAIQAPPKPAGPQLEVGGTESSVIREIVWSGAIALWRRYPLFGSGVETFAYGYYNVRPAAHNLVSEWDFLYNKAHNEFLNFLSTTGLVGLLTYVSIIVVFIIWSLKTSTNLTRSLNSIKRAGHPVSSKRDVTSLGITGSTPMLLLAFLCGYLALAISNFFGFSTVPVGVLFFLLPAFAFILATNQTDVLDTSPASRNTPLTTFQSLLLVVITAGTIIMLNRVKVGLDADIAYAAGKKNLDAGQLSPAILSLQQAVKLVPAEPVYTDELSLGLAQAATALKAQDKTDSAKTFADQAIAYSDRTLSLNKVHLNFYKTRARVFITLTQIDPHYIVNAQQALVAAIKLAPTDAKLWYNLALLYDQLDQKDQALILYQQTLALKPNYEGARMSLGALYEASGSAKEAIDQYQYILNYINPNNTEAATHIASLSALLK